MTTEPARKALTAADIIRFYEQFVKDWENYHNVRLQEEETKHKVEIAQQALQARAYMQQVDNFLDIIAKHFEQTDVFLNGLKHTQVVNTAITKTREAMLRDEITGLRKLVVDIKASSGAIAPVSSLSALEGPEDATVQILPPPTQARRKNTPTQTISAMAQRFVLNDESKSADTIKGTKTTLDLFIEAFGDLPVKSGDRNDRRRLSRLASRPSRNARKIQEPPAHSKSCGRS